MCSCIVAVILFIYFIIVCVYLFIHMYNFLCSDSLLYFFLFVSTLHGVYTHDCSCMCLCMRACLYACVLACVCAFVRACVCECVCVCWCITCVRASICLFIIHGLIQ